MFNVVKNVAAVKLTNKLKKKIKLKNEFLFLLLDSSFAFILYVTYKVFDMDKLPFVWYQDFCPARLFVK